MGLTPNYAHLDTKILTWFTVQAQTAEPFAWVATATLRDVRSRLGELRHIRSLLHQEEKLLHARRQILDPTSGRPLK